MYWLSRNALLVCSHESGFVGIIASQNLVKVDGVPVLVERDPEGRPIAGCPWLQPGLKPCTSTLPVEQGYSPSIRIDGRRVCLDTVNGLTDGTPPGTFKYTVRNPGQSLVSEV